MTKYTLLFLVVISHAVARLIRLVSAGTFAIMVLFIREGKDYSKFNFFNYSIQTHFKL